ADPGRQAFETRCARCHGGDGNGGEMGPTILQKLPARDDQQLSTRVREGIPLRGMPPSIVPDAEMAALIKYLRSIQRRPDDVPVMRMTVETGAGKSLSGQVL